MENRFNNKKLGGHVSGIKVEVRDGQLEKALRLFKKKIKDSRIMLELRDRQEFTKPSLTKRRNKNKAINRLKMEVLEEKRNNKY